MRLKNLFYEEICRILSKDRVDERVLRSFFGVSLNTIVSCWKRGEFKIKTRPRHLLWSLLFMKCYDSEERLANLVDADRKTYRKWIWPTIGKISDLHEKIVSRYDYF